MRRNGGKTETAEGEQNQLNLGEKYGTRCRMGNKKCRDRWVNIRRWKQERKREGDNGGRG